MSFKIINCSLQTTLQAGGTFTLTNSGSQLSRDSTVTTPVIPGADGFGHTDSLILNRYDCKHYKVTFSNDPNDDLTVDMNIELQINSYIEYTDSACKSNISWTITHITGKQFTQFYDFNQPGTSILNIDPDIVEPGEYLVCLDVAFPDYGDASWTTDCMAIRVYLPELVAHINGGEYLTVPHGDVVTLDATMSQDLISNMTSITSIPLEAFWSFAYFPVAPTDAVLSTFQAKAPYYSFPSGHTDHEVSNGTDYGLEVDSSMFPAGTLACVMFTLVRGDRHSSALQFLQFTTSALPLSIECVYNCQYGRERKINYDRVELNAVIDPAIDPLTLTYFWRIYEYYTNPLTGISSWLLSVTVSSLTGVSSSALEVNGFVEGNHYKIQLSVSGGGFATTVAEFIRTVNFLPYAGTCILDSSAVVSARDWVTLTCENWYGNDERKTKGADSNPLLNFVVRQTTENALVPIEPILNTRAIRSHVILKVGAPPTFETTLTSNPVFNYSAVTPNTAGADLIKAYTEVKYPFDEAQLQNMGKSDLIISLISAVCSNLHLVEVTYKMASTLKAVVENDVFIRRKGDKYLSELVSNGYNNIAAKSQYIGDDTKVKQAATMAVNLAQKIQDEMKLCKTCSNTKSTKTEQLLTKNTAENIANSTTSTKTSAFKIPGLFEAIANSSGEIRSIEDIAGEDVSVSAFEFEENVYMYDTDGTSSYVTSNVLRIDVKTSTARVTPGNMTFEQNVVTPDAVNISPKDFVNVEDVSEFVYHRFIYGKASDKVCMIIQPTGVATFELYDVYLGLKGPPSIEQYHLKITVRVNDSWQNCIESRDMHGHTGMVYYAVHVPGTVKQVDYNLTLITVGCLTWNEMQTKWETDKCEMEWKPLEDRLVCLCNEVTDLVFANSFFVAPNTIDFATVFLKFSPLSQAAVLGALTSLLFIYIVAVLYLKGLDRRDQLKWGITPLRDNTLGDSNYYLIKVMTGMRRGAGTTSRITFVLTGDKGDTGPREMFDGVRKKFSTGSVMSFFMASKRHLGSLEHLYIWHDNHGGGDEASWYLNQVVVYDIETRSTYTFVAEKWLSVETEVDANIPVTVSGKPVLFESRFFYQVRDRLSESHMWVSILYRPQTSTFTRVQRASCALAYLCLIMIANAMYFNPDDEYERPPLVQAGPFRFTSQQIFISIVCALITTPPVMLLIFLFKRSKRRPSGAGIYCGCWCSGSCCRSCSVCCWRLFRTPEKEKQRLYEQMLKTKMLSDDTPEFSGFYLPWW
ncbi:PK1L2-like protein [Mya arenaria]|uniref:PK1L2-like protein n=1 Tax=Mya arenaria TaxID=6604 RepID=A0ABY7EZH8_MYAAR|nr:PK1L2-like protein [Mya arenaria]